MSKSQVYFTDFRTCYGGITMPGKLQKLIRAAGIDQINMEGRFVAIKTHFGELGNTAYLRPQYARALVEVVKSLGGKPYLTDCNTLYVGSRKNALEHLYCAWENGFTPLSAGCPLIIADGLKGTDDVEVPVVGGEYVEKAKIGRGIMDADIIISLNHFKGHENTGFGGALKNLGMGCGSRAGKKEMHKSGKAGVDHDLCVGCKLCTKHCANNALRFDEASRKMSVVSENCVGCGRCIGACNFDAISFAEDNSAQMLNRRMAEYAKAVVDGRPQFHVSLVMDISPFCDCHAENDAPILPDVGMFASFDPVALDQACVDACLKLSPIMNSQLGDHLNDPDFHDHHDHFTNSTPESEWRSCLEHGEKIGLGSREYELVTIK
ncbi:MAG: DUF362 domain-containing protein [Clostridia bacterium]|nr:DUF362 domain-containing protein [Clostridia bacterium]